MAAVLTVTLNPALDLTAECASVVPGPKLRLQGVVREPGGGGVNVSRVIARLGGDTRAFVAWGGAVGAQHRALLEREVSAMVAFDLPGETRESLTVNDPDGQQFRFVLPGPDWTEALEDAALDAITRAAANAGPVVLSGSQPPGVGPAFPTRLAAALGPRRLILDTSGAALAHVLEGATPAPWVLRLDQSEAESLAGGAMPDVTQSLALARDLVARGVAGIVVLALGAEGSVLAARDHALHCRPPRVDVLSKVGAGDSFTGAFALELARGAALDVALRHGTAAAAAAVMSPASALCAPDEVARIARDCQIADHAARI